MAAKNKGEHRTWGLAAFLSSRFADEIERVNWALFQDDLERRGSASLKTGGQRRAFLPKPQQRPIWLPMKFPPEFLDEIRARLPVSEVVGKRVKLRKEGREWAALSPFTSEKTPSFFVNDQKGFFHDFSSGKHGDVFAFLMETEGLSFPGGGRAARRRWRASPMPTPERRRGGGGEEAREPDRSPRDGGAAVRSQPAAADRRQGARLSRRPRPRPRRAAALFARLCLARALCAARRAGRQGRRRRSDDRGGPAHPWARTSPCPTTGSATG